MKQLDKAAINSHLELIDTKSNLYRIVVDYISGDRQGRCIVSEHIPQEKLEATIQDRITPEMIAHAKIVILSTGLVIDLDDWMALRKESKFRIETT